jgi:hypothetical protein
LNKILIDLKDDIVKMTYWADNIRFIKEVQDSKYEKIEEAIAKLTEQLEILTKDETDPKAREIFHEASRTLEMANPDDLTSLGETMFKDMHECPEKDKEVQRLKEVQEKLKKFVGMAADGRKKYNITGV